MGLATESTVQGLCNLGLFSTPRQPGYERLRIEREAKQICSTCPVIQECRDQAVNIGEPYGIWGGLTAAERARIGTGVSGCSSAPARPSHKIGPPKRQFIKIDRSADTVAER